MKTEKLKRNLIKTAGTIALAGTLLTSGCASEEEKLKKESDKFFVEVREELRKHGCGTPNRCAADASDDFEEMIKAKKSKKLKISKKQIKKLATEKAKNLNHDHGGKIDGFRGDKAGL